MKRFSLLLTTVLMFVTMVLKAQDSANVYHFDFKKLKPVVQVFGTASYNFDNNNYGYSFGRAHLGIQYQFNEKWNAKIIIDRGRATSVGELTVTDTSGNILTVQNTFVEGAYYTMFLKFASLQWIVNDKLTLEGGAILQNHYITQEKFWGLRYVAQTFQDLYWKIPSSDLGFIAYYKINNIFSLDIAITNGEGPRVKQDAFGRVKFAGGINVNPSQKIETRFFYQNRQSKTNSEKPEQLFSVFAGYKPTAKLRIGGEFNYMGNFENISNLNSYGLSFYSAYSLTNKTELFARYDRLLYEVLDNIPISNKEDGNTFMAGISHSPFKGVNLSLNYQGWLPDKVGNGDNNLVLFSMEFKI
ncbi:MAG: hypothetical protein RBS23_01660 [Mariniphaga sp.]|nr:hypothetical protein [Mariniphaga sp.]